MQNQTILTISKQKNWDLCSPSVQSVRIEDDTLVIEGTVNEDATQEAEMRGLVRLCKSLRSEEIYNSFGKKAFRKQDKFWSNADDVLKKHVRHVADKRTVDAVRRASQQELPIFIDRQKWSVLAEDALSLSSHTAVPAMRFERTEQGIVYRLRLSIAGQSVIISKSHVEVLTNAPGLIVARIGNGSKAMLYALDEDFSAMLLKPFMEKDEVFIPSRMEKEYFQKFILKNARKAVIDAVGFDVVEKDARRTLLVCMEQTFTGKMAIILRYRYDNLTFDNDSKQKWSVTLEETDDSFRFVRISRDQAWEKEMRERIASMDGEWARTDDGAACSARFFDDKAKAIDWLGRYKKELDGMGDASIIQYSVRQHYIGGFSIRQQKTWVMDWLHLYIQIVLDDGTSIPFLYFRQAILAGEEDVQLPDGRWFMIPAEWFAEYGGMLMVAGSKGDTIVLHRSQLASLTPSIRDMENDLAAISDVKEDATCPSQLRAVLRPYQNFGFHWLLRNFAAASGCCLADDMGLGKTVQTIALLLKYKEECKPQEEVKANPKKTASVKGGKGAQLQMTDLFPDFFTEEQPSSEPGQTDGGKHLQHPYRTSLIFCPPSLVFNWRNELKRFAPSLSVCEYTGSFQQRTKKLQHLMAWDVVIVGYRTAVNDIELLTACEYGIAVFDESQTFKNRTSQVYQAMLRIKAIHRIALSGTPMENNLPELWSLMNVLNPLLLGDFKTFQQNFVNPIKESLSDVRTRILQRTVAPYFLGRRKEDVLTDLPLRQDEIVLCQMDEEQAHLYEEELSAARNVVLSSVPDLDEALRTGHCQTGQVNVLAAIGRLRQTANDPRLIGATAPSTKTATIMMHLEALRGTEHKVLLFSEYVSYLNVIASEMEQRGWTYSLLTGETQNREQVITGFESSADKQFFLISLKAGGVGLNLTCADYVFLLNPWWNLAAEEQAISRAHRIGQQKNVFVYRFIAQGTIEEQILTLQDRKKNLVDAVLPFLARG
ncbi:MAG: DEAD/DEAH box helicase [Bacteroidales bacterium]|nr:DEAD/DEAH box helicase [Bacteroidales bacterium]